MLLTSLVCCRRLFHGPPRRRIFASLRTACVQAYGYILAKASDVIADGSELLLAVMDPGLIGGLVLPVMGAGVWRNPVVLSRLLNKVGLRMSRRGNIMNGMGLEMAWCVQCRMRPLCCSAGWGQTPRRSSKLESGRWPCVL